MNPGATPDDAAAELGPSEAPALPVVLGTGRRDPLFSRQPLTGRHLTRHGVTAPTPFHCYDGDALVLLGTADATATRRVVPPGHEPLLTSEGQAIVTLWLMQYHDTSLGPYDELVVSVLVDTQPRTVAWTGPYSLLAAMSRPDACGAIGKLLLDRQLPIDYGREILGLDKRLGRFAYGRVGAVRTFAVTDARGNLVARGAVREERGLVARALSLVGLARASALAATIRSTLAGGQQLLAVTTDVLAPARNKLTDVWMKGIGTVHVIDAADTIELGPDSELGAELGALGFTPLLAYAHPHVKMIFAGTRASDERA